MRKELWHTEQVESQLSRAIIILGVVSAIIPSDSEVQSAHCEEGTIPARNVQRCGCRFHRAERSRALLLLRGRHLVSDTDAVPGSAGGTSFCRQLPRTHRPGLRCLGHGYDGNITVLSVPSIRERGEVSWMPVMQPCKCVRQEAGTCTNVHGC